MSQASFLVRSWYEKSAWLVALLPLSLVFYLLSALRRSLYRLGIAPTCKSQLPIIVVGNISVGGTGKTPLVVALVEQLRQAGFHPAIVSRGYGSRAAAYPYFVSSDDAPECSGDEPLLLAQRTGVPVVIDAKRCRAIAALQDRYKDCDVIIADDGLQHYAMPRDIEIVVIDGRRGFGNGWLLPAGPLRESVSRLNSVDYVVTNGELQNSLAVESSVMTLAAQQFVAVNGSEKIALQAWPFSKKIHAVAGIGNPQRFFESLQRMGFDVIPHAFSDHHDYRVEELCFDDQLPVLMTEKDAVKVRQLFQQLHLQPPLQGEYWYLTVDAILPPDFYQKLIKQLQISIKQV